MLADELNTLVQGEVLTDEKSRTAASRDASVFAMTPEVVVAPKNAEDIEAVVKWASSKKEQGAAISLTPRSAGTDMSGGTITDSVVLDISKHMNKFIGVRHSESGEESLPADRQVVRLWRDGAYSRRDPSGLPRDDIKIAGYAVVEPGMFYRDFEKETLKQELLLPTYPASREICTVGGMVANNSGGEKTLAYGKTEDYIAELKIVLADGKEHVIRALNRAELEAKTKGNDFEGELYRKLFELLDGNYEVIKKAKPDVSKNSAGYYLWNVWDREKGVFDLTKLLVGSQGTLGIITEITFRLIKPKPHSLMMVFFLHDLKPIADITNALLKFKPESLECYDDKTLKLAIRFFPAILARVKQNFIAFSLSFLPDLWMLIRHGMPKLVVMAEFTGDNEPEIYGKLQKVKKAVAKFGIPEHMTRHETEESKYWTIRRESFNLLRQHVKGKHTAPVIDDIIVKPEHLPKFLPELESILAKYSSKMMSTLAGHNGNGNFHVIPLMDFKDPEARAMLKPLMEEVYTLVLKYRGSITAEHNDGIIRTPFLEKMYGPVITGFFREVKNIFDPMGVFNPGKKVGGNLDKAFRHLLKD